MLSQRRTSDWFLRRGGRTAEMVAEAAAMFLQVGR